MNLQNTFPTPMANIIKAKSQILKTNIESLPDDLVCRILLQISARDIYEGARLVCRKWYNIIRTDDFINAHLQHSTSGLLIQSLHDERHPIFLTMRQSRAEISKFSYEFGSSVWPGCNGLILQHCYCDEENFLYVVNPATKQSFALPRFPCGSLHQRGIGFASNSKEYKVVCTVNCGDAQRCFILTVGVDKSWRPVCTQHLPPAALELLGRFPVVTDGFMHWWSGAHTHILICTHILTLNMETEIITQTPVPQGCGEKFKYLLSSERYLTLVVDSNNYSWDIWEMNPEIGEWTKLFNIDFEAHKCLFQKSMYGAKYVQYPKPSGWLSYKEVLIFNTLSPIQDLFTYNVRTLELDVLKLDICPKSHFFFAHRSSMVWPGGCYVA